MNNLQPINEDATEKDTVLLRVLVKGATLNLYELFDFKDHYYIENTLGNYVELIYKIGLNDSRIINRHEYRGQLKEYAVRNENEQVISAIDKAEYQENDLRNIVVKINGDNIVYGREVIKKKTASFLCWCRNIGQQHRCIRKYPW